DGPAQLPQSFQKRGVSRLHLRIVGDMRYQCAYAPYSVRLLRARRERPCERRSAQQGDELAALHSITSSARSRIDDGSVIPISFAVFKFATSWNRVGRSAGNSATFAPCRTLRAIAPT